MNVKSVKKFGSFKINAYLCIVKLKQQAFDPEEAIIAAIEVALVYLVKNNL